MRPARSRLGVLPALVLPLVAGLAPPAVAQVTTTPVLHVVPVMTGLDRPWDVAFGSDGTMLVTERSGRLRVSAPGRPARLVTADLRDLWVEGETGLMGVETDPGFVTNRRFYTCQGTLDGDRTVQVVAWQLDLERATATRVADPLVGGVPGTTGRHGGCQLRVDGAGHLVVGTGDAAVGTSPQDPTSLAGKTLRVDRTTGAGVPGNPFHGTTRGDGRVLTLGHRNVQGLALQPGTGALWSAEHGTSRDDELNLLAPGANFGWDPVPGYDESTPMTKPGFVPARWSSGAPTIATSGATFLRGAEWGGWDGRLAVAALKDTSLRVFDVSGSTAVQVGQPAELDDDLGRLRGAELGPDGVLYVTTDNGGGADRVLGVTPSAISAKHLALGGLAGLLGPPVSAERSVTGGRVRDYAGGTVHWSPATGAHEVHGAVRATWQRLGAEASAVGRPVTDETGTPDGRGRYNHFERGSVYWTSSTGAREVRGAVRETWARLGWERGPVGYPVTDETGTPDGRGRYNHFEHGSVYWSPTTRASEVRGAVREAWARLGWERSALGYPVTDETGTPDRRGRYNHFQHGSVYWSPTTGAHEVRGAIREAWAQLGWESGRLGYPVSDEYAVPEGRRSDFQGGSVTWDSRTGRLSTVLR